VPPAYVATSCLVAIAFGEAGAASLARRLGRFSELLGSNLVEAELLASYRREEVEPDPALLGAITWVIPDRRLEPEITRVLEAGYLRGADCWHLATALYVAPDPGQVTFLTMDTRQRAVAASLGFKT